MENDLKNNFSSMQLKTLRSNLDKLQKWRKMGRTGITKRSIQFTQAGLKLLLANFDAQQTRVDGSLPALAELEDLEAFVIEFAGSDCASDLDAAEVVQLQEDYKVCRELLHFSTRKHNLFTAVTTATTTGRKQDVDTLNKEIELSRSLRFPENSDQKKLMEGLRSFFAFGRASIDDCEDVSAGVMWFEVFKSLCQFILSDEGTEEAPCDLQKEMVDEAEDLLVWCDIHRTLEVVEASEAVGYEIVEKYEVELQQMDNQLVSCDDRVANVEAATEVYDEEKVPFHTFWALEIVTTSLLTARSVLETCEQAELDHQHEVLRECVDDLEEKAGGGVGGALWFEGFTSSLVYDCFRYHRI